MSTTIQTITAEELLLMGSDARFELVRGGLEPMSPAGSEHGRIITRLMTRMSDFASTHQVGEVFGAETGFILARNPDTVRAPDIAFVNATRLREVGNIKEFWPEAPDLAVEVISPSEKARGIEAKLADFLGAGAREVWIVDPRDRSITIHRVTETPVKLNESDLLDCSLVLPGFAVRVKDIFPESGL